MDAFSDTFAGGSESVVESADTGETASDFESVDDGS